MQLQCGAHTLNLMHTQIMGVLNVTPDSFSDGGQYVHVEQAVAQAEMMVAQGASIIDIGGESTRPGAADVPVDVELERVIPVVEALSNFNAVISVDTMKPEVMQAAISAGAGMINDVNGFAAQGAWVAVAASSVALCIMHMQGQPRTMQQEPVYRDVVVEVVDYLQSRLNIAMAQGVSQDRIVVDPGFGFGKQPEHNLQLLAKLTALKPLGCPVLAGLSRKSLIGHITGAEVGERLPGSLALALVAVLNGANIVRVHDVAETAQVMKIIQAVQAVDGH